jgi:energy-coupling factor transporter ATP-binding protein EcfA2
MNALDPATPDPTTVLERADAWTAALQERGLAAAPAIAVLQQTLAHSRDERLDTAADPFLVLMLCGPTAVGKSSLINVLAQAEISRRGIGATTSAAVLYVHEQDDPARLYEYSETLGQLARTGATLVRHNRDELLHKVLVDTPDIDSVMRHHREMTEALVHHSDLVLFVTSPERYKIMEAAGWLAGQRQQRAIGFVLNKWDRETLGLDYDRRHLVEQDFRAVLTAEGFSDPLIFKVSALDAASDTPNAENQIAELRAWIERGLTRSAATAIQDRRRRAAWGRLAAAIAPAIPAPLSNHPLAADAPTRFAGDRSRAKGIIEAEAVAVTVEGLDRSVRPVTPGLLGSWIRFWDRIGGAAASFRGLFAFRKIGSQPPGAEASGFGQSAAVLLAQVTSKLAQDAEFRRLPLGPVPALWEAEASQLQQRLGSVVAEAEAQVIAESVRLSVRRFFGYAALYAVELALVAVLGLTLYRIGMGFVAGDYVTGALLTNAVALMIALLFVGQVLGNLFFPPLQARLRRVVLQRAAQLIDGAWQQAQAAFTAQLQAADTLAQEGRQLMAAIDGTVSALAPPTSDDSSVHRLFGGPVATVDTSPQAPVRRRVVLD